MAAYVRVIARERRPERLIGYPIMWEDARQRAEPRFVPALVRHPQSGCLGLAGAPGFEPGDGGIKIRCLTTWLRPNTAGAPRIAAHSAEFNETLRPAGSRPYVRREDEGESVPGSSAFPTSVTSISPVMPAKAGIQY